jgi:hypothetical protein
MRLAKARPGEDGQSANVARRLLTLPPPGRTPGLCAGTFGGDDIDRHRKPVSQ